MATSPGLSGAACFVSLSTTGDVRCMLSIEQRAKAAGDCVGFFAAGCVARRL